MSDINRNWLRGLPANRLAPDTQADGAPNPDATAGWQQLYQDWQARGQEMPPLGQWLRGLPMQGLGFVGGVEAPGVRAYHGSPHSFERFDLGKIGTGEGAQAYGHGLYFAENEGTARSYRDKLAGTVSPTLARDVGAAIDSAGVHPEVAAVARSHAGNPGDLPAILRNAAGDVPAEYAAQFHHLADNVDAALKPPGSMYEVNIGSDPEHFLHWDKPLSEQSPHVQQALAKAKLSQPPSGFTEYDPPGSELWQKARGQASRDYDGTIPAAEYNPAAIATQRLRDAGIPGIRYLDQGSRGAGDGTHNLVVFNPENIEILRKYGLAGLGLGTAAAAAQPGETDQ